MDSLREPASLPGCSLPGITRSGNMPALGRSEEVEVLSGPGRQVLLAIANVLLVASAMMNLLALKDGFKHPPEGRTWRAKFVAGIRRRPLLRGIQLTCLAVALVLDVSYAIVMFG